MDCDPLLLSFGRTTRLGEQQKTFQKKTFTASGRGLQIHSPTDVLRRGSRRTGVTSIAINLLVIQDKQSYVSFVNQMLKDC
jgi:hypothetical protein